MPLGKRLCPAPIQPGRLRGKAGHLLPKRHWLGNLAEQVEISHTLLSQYQKGQKTRIWGVLIRLARALGEKRISESKVAELLAMPLAELRAQRNLATRSVFPVRMAPGPMAGC